MTNEQIANDLLDLAQEIAERRHVSGIAIESLSDQLIPQIDSPAIAAVVQDSIESWAYTWLDYLQGGIAQPMRDHALAALLALPLKDHLPCRR